MANRGIASGTAFYLYGISKSSGAKPGKVAAVGIDGVHPVRSIAHGNFICWVSAVDPKSFSDAINSNMENLEWLALHGVRHQQVVAEIFAGQTIIPARFGTVFSGEPALVKNLQERESALKKVFAKISSSEEWGVKIFAEQAPAAPVAQQVRSGKDYLQLKAAKLKKRPDRDSAGLKELATKLEKIAIDSASTGKVSGSQPNLLWQATFLVPKGRRKQWDGVLKEFVEKWSGKRRIEVNGPWPPYSFVADAE
ncbi:MAG TPA: GvpL/GvpF family gas vesicle protein [Candidatus Solibacter sp.]|nr:GvpL/GvpF family gas vesicle protein [Candidatus Solibacter sp.]